MYDPDEFFNRKPNVIKFKCAVCGHLTPIQTQDLPPLLWRDDLITTTEFMTHSGGNGYELHFRTPDREKYLEVQEVCRKVIDHGKPQTNADRIRQMDDAELAEYLFDRGNDTEYCYGICAFQDRCRGPYQREFCLSQIETWLQQEVDNG